MDLTCYSTLKRTNIENYGEFFAFPEDIYIGKTICGGGPWEWYMLGIFDKYIDKDSVVLDIGANIGCHTVQLAKRAKHIYAFEPQKKLYNLLLSNLLLNNCTNVTLFNKAVGSTFAESKFPTWASTKTNCNLGGASLIPNYHGVNELGETKEAISTNNHGETVNIIPLDSLEFPKISFMKVDIEGYEMEFLKGAVKTITRDKPIILIEIHQDEFQEATLIFLSSLNYRIESVPNAPVWDKIAFPN